MNIEELKVPIDGVCKAMQIACEKAGADIDADTPTRAEIVFFVLYLIIDEGGFDENDLELIEQAAGFQINREHWNEIIELGRVDSEENYLSQPPAGIILMSEADNALYDAGESFACVNAVMDVYKAIGEAFVNIKGFTDNKRSAKLKRFLEMVDKYQRDNSKDPNAKSFLSKDSDLPHDEKVVPFKKGVKAPKKS